MRVNLMKLIEPQPYALKGSFCLAGSYWHFHVLAAVTPGSAIPGVIQLVPD